MMPAAGIQDDRKISLETKYLRLREPVSVGHLIDGWRVCWLGCWDRSGTDGGFRLAVP